MRGQLTSRKRWFYRVLLVTGSVIVSGVLSLWLTEPGPLPLQLHIAFAAIVFIGTSWIGVFTWILCQRSFANVSEHLITAWAATISCCGYLAIALPITIFRGNITGIVAMSVSGILLIAFAVTLLVRAYKKQSQLRVRLYELEADKST